MVIFKAAILSLSTVRILHLIFSLGRILLLFFMIWQHLLLAGTQLLHSSAFTLSASNFFLVFAPVIFLILADITIPFAIPFEFINVPCSSLTLNVTVLQIDIIGYPIHCDQWCTMSFQEDLCAPIRTSKAFWVHHLRLLSVSFRTICQ